MGVAFVKSTMSASPSVISLYQGQTKIINLQVQEFSTDVDGNTITTPMDLTGCTLYLMVRDKIKEGLNPRAIITKISTNSAQISISTPTTCGQAIITFIPSDTQYQRPGKYLFDMWVVTPSEQQFPIIEVSDFIINQPIVVIP